MNRFRPWRPPELKRGEATALTIAFAVLAAMLLVTAVLAIFGIGGAAAVKPIEDWLSPGVYVLVAAIFALRAIRVSAQRNAWAMLALGLALYGLGNVLWALWISNLRNPPIPSICDALWLTLYPLSYAGIVGLARRYQQPRVSARMWLDGIIAGSGLAAIGAALVFPQILASTSGGAVARATELAYPIGDLLLAALVVGVLALRGWRVNRTWGLLGAGFLLLAVADCIYGLEVAGGSSSTSALDNLFYFVAVALLAVAAWQEPELETPSVQIAPSSLLFVPGGFTVAALVLVLYDHFHRLDSTRSRLDSRRSPCSPPASG
jgi:diguanylate cyclase